MSYSDINNNNSIEPNEILSVSDYYPFGLQHSENSRVSTANAVAEKYQYNGKEFQEELNLNVFDYGARNYDAAIGRWFNHDPLSEMAYDLTPYRYSFNNPINFIDPNGMFETKFGAWWHKLWNGSSDAGGIEYNDQRSEYYYNDMVARYIKFARVKERIFLLSEVSYEYKSVFINGGVSDRLKIIFKNKTVIKPVANIYSLSSIQLDSLVAKMRELGVKGEVKV